MTAEFSAQVVEVITIRSDGWCEICDSERATEIHHRRPRGMGGTQRDASSRASNGLHCCRTCHRFIESYRNVAIAMGWLVSSLSDPAGRSVVYRGVRVRLSDDGTLEAT